MEQERIIQTPKAKSLLFRNMKLRRHHLHCSNVTSSSSHRRTHYHPQRNWIHSFGIRRDGVAFLNSEQNSWLGHHCHASLHVAYFLGDVLGSEKSATAAALGYYEKPVEAVVECRSQLFHSAPSTFRLAAVSPCSVCTRTGYRMRIVCHRRQDTFRL